jgi:hypothetical protein
MLDWLNCQGNAYVQYCFAEQLPEKLVTLIDRYDFAFDDTFWYWRVKPRSRANKRIMTNIIKRSPSWTYPQKSIPTEKRKDPFQRKLLLE